jgi:hypothetical protein
MKIHPTGGVDQTLPRNLRAKIAMQYFRFLPNPAKLRREARWSGVSFVPDIGDCVQPSAEVGAGTVRMKTTFINSQSTRRGSYSDSALLPRGSSSPNILGLDRLFCPNCRDH